MKKNTIKKAGGILVLALVILTTSCRGDIQTDAYVKGFRYLSEESIYTGNILDTIEELTSPKYEGRLAGSQGNRLTEDYISEYFKSIGLQSLEKIGGYKQTYSQQVMATISAPVLQIQDRKGIVVSDFTYPYNFINSGAVAGTSVKGEINGEGYVIKSKEELKNKEGLKGKVLIVNKDIRSQIGNNNNLMTAISGAGAAGLILEVDITNSRNPYKHLPISPYAMDESMYNSNGPLIASAESNTFKKITDAALLGNLIHMKVDYEPRKVELSNIIGVIPGSDPKLKDEYIIVGGHLDHVGDNKNGTYNSGALDNASGVAAMMEIAKAVMENKTPPKRTIVFIAFNGEEEGLYGAYHFAENPPFPMNKENTVVINLDMVGSKDKMPLTLGNYSELETDLREDLFKYAQDLNIDCEKAVESASDHTPFAQMGIQALTLIHLDIENPAYHTPLDTLSNTIDKDRIGQVAKLVLYYLDKNGYN